MIIGFLSIDDSLKEIIPRIICYNAIDRNGIDSEVGHNFTINHFSTPMLYKDRPYFNTLMHERNLSFREVGAWINEGRLIVLDSENGRSFDFFAASLRNVREKHPNKKVIFFLDKIMSNLNLVNCWKLLLNFIATTQHVNVFVNA